MGSTINKRTTIFISLNTVEQSILEHHWTMVGEEDETSLFAANLFKHTTIVGVEDVGKDFAWLYIVASYTTANIDAGMVGCDGGECLFVDEG